MHGESGHEAQGQMQHEKPQEKLKEGVNLVGQVIDPVCTIRHDSMGKEHADRRA